MFWSMIPPLHRSSSGLHQLPLERGQPEWNAHNSGQTNNHLPHLKRKSSQFSPTWNTSLYLWSDSEHYKTFHSHKIWHSCFWGASCSCPPAPCPGESLLGKMIFECQKWIIHPESCQMHKAFSSKDDLLKGNSFNSNLNWDILSFLAYSWACQNKNLVIFKKLVKFSLFLNNIF